MGLIPVERTDDDKWKYDAVRDRNNKVGNDLGLAGS